MARRLLRDALDRMFRDASVTHAHIGARLGISRAAVSQLISGKGLPSRAVLEVPFPG